MKTINFRRVSMALVIAVTAAVAQNFWFARAGAAAAGPNDAQIRVMTWDTYERTWVGVMIAAPTVDGPFTLRSAEGYIVELRPRQAGHAIDASSIPTSILEVLTPQDLQDEGITLPVSLPADNNGVSLPGLLAEGASTFVRLKLSRPSVISETRPVDAEVWAGPLNPTLAELEAPDVDGSVGVHAMMLTTNSGTDTINFTWDIGRWAKGDMMVGLSEATYKVLDRNGEFKRFLGSADYGMSVNNEPLNIFTTGCAANWRTGEFYAQNFSFEDPAVNIFARHPGGSGDAGWLRPYANSTRRISTVARRLSNPSSSPVDKAPETVLFDSALNMYVGHSFGFFGPPPTVDVDGELVPAPGFEDFALEQDWDEDGNFQPSEYEWGLDGLPISWTGGGSGSIVDETGAILMIRRIDSDEDFYEAGFGYTSQKLLHVNGALQFSTMFGAEMAAPISAPQMFFAHPEDGEWVEREGAAGSRIPVRWPLGKRLHRYNNVSANPQGAPTFNSAARDIFWTATSQQGTDAIDLTIDNILYYTSEDSYIHRYDTVNGVQLPDLGGDKLQVWGQHAPRRFAGVRLLPPGDGTGGLLVVGGDGIFRFDENGNYLQAYQVLNDPDLVVDGDPDTGLQQNFYALEIDPSGRTFWALANFTTGWIYQFDIASGRELKRLKAVDYLDFDEDPEVPNGRRAEGLCIMWEYTAAQEICGNNADDDGDGLIDESCSPIESCSVNSPGDDDGDGRADNNDADCGDELPPVAVDDLYETRQGTPLAVSVNAFDHVLTNDYDPDNAPNASPIRVDVVEVSTIGTSGTPAVAAGSAIATAQGGTVTLQASGAFLYQPAAGYHGMDSFVYRVNDGVSDSNIATVRIRVIPFVTDDAYTVNEQTTLMVTGRQVSPAGILVNDSAAPMTIVAAGASSLLPVGSAFTTLNGGTVAVSSNGDFSYTPASTFTGVDTFRYLGNDGVSDSWNIATVRLTVVNVNEVRAYDDGEFTTAFGVPFTANVRANDFDPEGHPFSVTHINGTPVTAGGASVAVPNGTAQLTVAGSIRITPNASFTGLITFPYTITDQPGGSIVPATATANVRLRVGNTTLQVANDNYETRVNTPLTIVQPGILLNDTTGGRPLHSVTQSGGLWLPFILGTVTIPLTEYLGTAIVLADGSFIYTPALNFQGVDSFDYRIYDETTGNYNKATVRITVRGVATVTAGNGTKVYGTPDPALSAITTSGFRSADLPGITLAQTRVAGETVAGGPYATNATATGGNINQYVVTYVPGSFTITKAPSTTTVTGGTYVYDGTAKPQTCTVTGRTAAGAPLTLTGGTVTYSPGTGAPVAVGTYTATCSFAGDANHFGSSGTNTVVITPKAATVTAGTGTKVYGATDPALTAVTTSGFVGSDLTSVALAQSRAAGQNVGSYVTTPTASGAVLGNYTVTYIPNTFTITKAPLTVRANNKTKVQGQANPTLDGSITGAVNGDVFSATYATTAVVTSPVGSYPIVPTLVDAGNRQSNYTVTIINGTLTVTASGCDVNGYTTYSQGGWGSKPSGNNPGALLASKFSTVYPSGYVTIGGTYKMKFTSATAIEKYLPAGGSTKALTTNYTNPTSSPSGNIGGQLLALKLAVDFSAAGVTKRGLGDLVMKSGPLAGKSVDQIVAMADAAMGGTSSALPSGMSLSTLAGILESIIMNYHEGTVNEGLLDCPGPSAPPCTATTFQFTGNSSTSGSAGNVRTFAAGGVNVKASAFSRTKSAGTWNTAFLGAWSWGMGVTDGSEGSGDGDLHKVDNGGDRTNYILFVFDKPVTITRAYLDSIGGDSDAQFWVGTVTNAYATTLSLNDTMLSALAGSESTTTSTSARWADFNTNRTSGNVVVVAAKTNESNDAFKVSKFDATCVSQPPTEPEPVCTTSTLQFTGSSSGDGTDGNIRSYAVGGVNVKASAFSRTKSGSTWAKGYLGVWSQGMGVTDSGEGDGGNDRHKLDNYDRNNYILLVFDKEVTVTKAYLDSIGGDSDAQFWVGNVEGAYTASSALQLSDSLLAGFTASESSTSSSSARWAEFNSGSVKGNILVVAAKTSETNDAFKLSKIEFKSCTAGEAQHDDEDDDHEHDDRDCRDSRHYADRDDDEKPRTWRRYKR